MESTPVPDTRHGKNLIDRFFIYLRQLPPSDSLFIKIGVFAFFVFTVWWIVSLSSAHQVEVSSKGGSLSEGIVGTPRFVNPVLAVTRADKDASTLIYDGLMKLGTDGSLEPNVAKSVTVSEDGLVYNIVLKEDVFFHDGERLTAEDVAFTIARIQERALSSPLRPNFEGVSVEQLDEYEINFILPEPYAPFIENLTFGILPHHIWKDATNEEFPFSQYNSEPIGAGPYQVTRIIRSTSGIPERYILAPHSNYHRAEPKISRIELHFFPNETEMVSAFNERTIDSIAGINHTYVDQLNISDETHQLITVPMPRTFALFFNQNKSAALRDLDARRALDAAINREQLIDTVLDGYAESLHSPIPPGFGVTAPTTSVPTSTDAGFEKAETILEESGWERNEESGIWEKEIDETLTPLAFSISTANNVVFEKTAEFLRSEWEKLGASVTVKQFEQSDLTQAVIRPRDYESLLFGTVVGRGLDFYSFWHSSQRNDPGLNVALYANITTDSILDEARTKQDQEGRTAALLRFAEEVEKEVPAIFLYSPEMLYIFPNGVTSASFRGIAQPQERFSTVTEWFVNAEGIWPIMNRNDDT